MAQSTDITNTLADQLWTLLEAQATITAAVLPANRNKGTEQGWLRDSIANLPLDRRRLRITFARFRNSLYSLRDGFSSESKTFTASNPEFWVKRNHEAVIEYREPYPDDPGANPIKEAIEQTIFLAGPVLGLTSLVDSLGEIAGETRDTRDGEFPFPGRVTTIRLPIITTQSAVALIQQTV